MKKEGMNGSSTKQSKSAKAAKLLDIYIRNNKKQALLVHAPPRANIEHISRAIRSRLGVPTEDQVLFHNGQRIDPQDHHQQLQIEDKAVIHLVDRRNVNREITVNVRKLNVARVQQFRIPSAQIIQDFIVRNIREEQPEKMFFVYTGRHLKKNRSFAEEMVQNESQLFCLHQDRDEVRGQRRKYYEKKMKEEKEKNQEKYSKYKGKAHKEQEQGDNVLVNYLPRERRGSQERSQSDQNEEVKPNFKKKQIKKEINISSGNAQPLQKSNIGEGNLSTVNENSHSGMGYFNDGSSISEIIPDYNQNPESAKKIQEGSMFQSAIMGFNAEPSQVTTKSPENDIPEEDQLEGSKEKESFSFDARAPELLESPDKQLTVLQRQIMEVTQSQEESKEKNSFSEDKKEEGSIEHSQFELGEVQNHMLSASTEMKVEDPSSPLPRQQKNEILIEEQQSQDTDRSEKGKRLQYVDVEIEEVSNEPSESEDERIDKKLNSSEKEDIEFQEERSNETPLLSQNIPQQEEVELFVIQQEGNLQSQTPTASQMIEKEELETHGPSSHSNAYSKNSSRVKQFQPQPNQYEFGYSKPLNRPTTQSSCFEVQLKSEENLLETPKSERNDKSNSLVEHSTNRYQEDQKCKQKDHNDSEDLQLQIVDPLDIKTDEHARDLMNFDSELVLKSGLETAEKKGDIYEESKIKVKKDGSRIDELNCLLIDNTPKKVEEKEEPQGQSKDSNLLSHQSSIKHQQSDIKVENESLRESNNISKESLQLIRLKKTQGAVSKIEFVLKNAASKFNFELNSFIFKKEVNYFDPLEFYLNQLEQETLTPSTLA